MKERSHKQSAQVCHGNQIPSSSSKRRSSIFTGGGGGGAVPNDGATWREESIPPPDASTRLQDQRDLASSFGRSPPDILPTRNGDPHVFLMCLSTLVVRGRSLPVNCQLLASPLHARARRIGVLPLQWDTLAPARDAQPSYASRISRDSAKIGPSFSG